jgi:hypothetical protein
LYYRLKEVDQDGLYKYSGTVLLRMGTDNASCKLFPNPGKGLYTIQLGEMPAAPVSLKVFNSVGQAVANDKFTTQTYQLSLQAQGAGIYYMKLTYADGSMKEFTLIKN